MLINANEQTIKITPGILRYLCVCVCARSHMCLPVCVFLCIYVYDVDEGSQAILMMNKYSWVAFKDADWSVINSEFNICYNLFQFHICAHWFFFQWSVFNILCPFPTNGSKSLIGCHIYISKIISSGMIVYKIKYLFI